MADKIDLLSLSLAEIDRFLADLGLEGYRSSQIKRWIFKEGVTAFDQMSNLSKKTKSLLEKNSFLSRLKIEKILFSSDGAKKYIFQVDQENTIESVLIPDKSRLTLCISTQAGCSRGCKFCLTGKKGLSRNLTSSEIINQVLEVKRDIGKEIRISNLVIMGMGEPLDNFENVKKTVTIMLDREGFDFSSRRITLSTSGVIPGIKDLIESGLNINLAVSLNASSDKKRDVLMPVNRAFPLKELIVMIKNYPLKKRSRITFEYILLGGINDSLEDAENLVRLLKGIKAKINLLNFNPFPGSKFSLSSPGRVLEFQNFLMSKNLAVNLRKSRGIDILAACGQLGGKG
ncbi:MAG: 23S rRNA (adenine(2503)-C(2))-methyltransferase [Candidatus Schekmanbacteria bacterium GWA2_38_11]|uniref:Probable dual-specificity RNA methyltransferase RlmN n=1 Tax=Candidatus Schekmanbacteria bacterium GWA2_38_11 TaxID=1817876 RepID=A0A1F7RA66_9BACT|nr:MAG: 23S rRNA (adenine(2503)-C(2))-methyltransferase [Candidatus Schekmanbacteria bacterium GWA2_38_11]